MPRIPSSFRNNLIDRVIRELNPGAEDAIFPRTLEDGAIFTFSGRPLGMEWRASQMIGTEILGDDGVIFVNDTVVATTGLRYYHAIAADHNDATPRDLFISIRANGQDTQIASSINVADGAAFAANQFLIVMRPIVIGETGVLRATVPALAPGSRVRLKTYAANQGLGSDLPGL